ncbi:deoxyhypusine synthase family protein [Desulfococcaceae bacterium HSG8]|nr:deoxyhypusine synthase family protein [Desulfococcaceae bacterium HSG8]
MSRTFTPIDLTPLKTYPISQRKSKVCADDFASPWKKGGSFGDFLENLPGILGASDIREVISAISAAFKSKKTIMLAMGAHVIKVGLNPIIIDLMKRGIITAVAMNGAGIIHDSELAMAGQTSEDVAVSIGDGTFGMAKETGEFLNSAIQKADEESVGLGQAVGMSVIENRMPFMDKSILAAGARFGIPVTVHIAIGTDIIHMHPGFDAEKAGGASHRDFRTFASVVSTLERGVYLNVGSAVILPEVFLKAITLVRNLGHLVKDLTTVNLDFIRHYRPMTNVVNRPTLEGGKGINLVGHHEIILPLIAAGVIEEVEV